MCPLHGPAGSGDLYGPPPPSTPRRIACGQYRSRLQRRSSILLGLTALILLSAQLIGIPVVEAGDRAVEADLQLIVRLRPAGGGSGAAGMAGLAPVQPRVESVLLGLETVWESAYPESGGALDGGATGVEARSALLATRVLSFPTMAARDAAVNRLRDHPEVVYVEPVRAFQLEPPAPDPAAGSHPPGTDNTPEIVPDDPLYPDQWSLPRIGMPAVWDGGTETPDILVGVVDTGIEVEHPDLAPNLAVNAVEAAGRAGVDDDGNGFIDDIHGWDFMAAAPTPNDGYGHGTHVAGIIGAAADGTYGTVGVTWRVRLLAVKMFTDQAIGTNLSGAQGIVYAVDRGAQIINMSWGTGAYSPAIRDAIAYAAEAGVVLVASAGNKSTSVLEFYPAALDPVITVGASNAFERLAAFSNRGPRLDLIAPGVSILSTWRGRHLTMNGTSQAAPHVAGVAAHLLHRHPGFSVEQVRTALLTTAVDYGRVGWEPSYGFGRLDAAAALAVTSPPVAAILSPRTLDSFAAGHVPLRATVQGEGADGELEFGVGEDPLDWEILWSGGSGVNLQLGGLAIAELDEGDYTLRLTVTATGGAWSQDRVLVRVDRSAPGVLTADSVQLLSGGRLRQLVRVEADERVRLAAHVRPVGDSGPFDTIIKEDIERDHTLDFTERLPGVHEFQLVLVDLAGNVTREPASDPLWTREVLPPIDIPADPFEEVARLEGFELGVVADLDGDGSPELLGELRDPGRGSGPLQILSLDGSPSAYRHRFTGLRGLPLDAHDIDANGIIEVLLADSLGSAGPDGSTVFSVYTRFLIDEPELLARWEDGDRRFGGGFADTDGDRRGEVLYANSDGAVMQLREYTDGAFLPIELGFADPVPRTAGFAIDDFDGDGLTEIAMGTLAGDALVLEYEGPGANRLREVFREPLRGGLSNAVVAAHVQDADSDGRNEFAISTVGVISDRDQRPAVVLFEAVADNEYVESSWFEVSSKNNPFDNALTAADLSGDGRPEVLVAMAGDVYALQAAGDDRYVPTWHTPRAGGGRLFSADLDRDGRREVMVVERGGNGPVTVVYQQRIAERPLALGWEVRERVEGATQGVEVRWEASHGDRLFDLAIYRLSDADPEPQLESDIAEHRIHAELGELAGAGVHVDPGWPRPGVIYRVAYTAEYDGARRRILAAGRTPAPAAPQLLLGAVRPTPFRGSTSMQLTLTQAVPVEFEVFDVSGRLLRALPVAQLQPGTHALRWDGRDTAGHAVPSGVYFLRVTTPLGTGSRKVIRLR